MLFSIKEKISLSQYNTSKTKELLVRKGFLTIEDGVYKLTPESTKVLAVLDSYFIKAKKKTDAEIMGKDFVKHIEQYREIFPAKRLPSGKPARQNIKALSTAFRWFFTSYGHTWEDIIRATKMYVNEYRDKDYKYMVTSQYFVCKQDKNKVKSSPLADYCDLIKEGIDTEDKHFKEKVV